MNIISAIVVMTSVVGGGEPTDYATAYKNAMNSDKPLLVLVTAEWCPPCQNLKRNTLPELVRNKTLKDCHFAMVDFDRESKTAQSLVAGQPVPQFILFEKKDGKWTKKHLVGYQTVAGVQSFIQPAVQRVAKNVDVKPDLLAKQKR